MQPMQKPDNILPESSAARVFWTSASGRSGGEVLYFPCERRGMVHFLNFTLGSRTSALGGPSLWIAGDCPCPTIRRFLYKSAHCPWDFAHFHAYKIQVFTIISWSEEPPGALSGLAWKTTLLHTSHFQSSILQKSGCPVHACWEYMQMYSTNNLDK